MGTCHSGAGGANALSDLSGKKLSENKIAEVNEARRQLISQLRNDLSGYPADERNPKLANDDVYMKYSQLEDDPNTKIARMSLSNLQDMKRLNDAETRWQKRKLLYFADNNGYRVDASGNDKLGSRLTDYNDEMKKRNSVKDSIEAAIKKKADNFVKRKNKNKS